MNTEKISFNDVLFAYGGLRPLVEDNTKGSYESSRKYEISTHEKDGIKGLLTVEGGKYTTSRHLAEKVIDKSFKLLNRKLSASETAGNIPDLIKTKSNILLNYMAPTSMQY